MKKLFIVRHASAVPGGVGPDRKRVLAKKGHKEAEEMAFRLSKAKIADFMLLSSPADRALQTAKAFARELMYHKNEILTSEILYSGSPGEILEEIGGMELSCSTLLIFGHNPTFSYLCEMLAPGFNRNLPKCCVVGIDFDCNSWKEMGKGKVSFLDYPNSKKKLIEPVRELKEELKGLIKEHLRAIDPEAADAVEKNISKASTKLASRFLSRSVKKVYDTLE